MMCFDYHKLLNREGLHLKQMGCYCIWFLHHNTLVYTDGDRPQIWVMLTTALLIERRSLLHLKPTKQSPLIYMLYKDTIEKYNPEVINLDIKDPAPHLNPHLQFYFSLLKDDVVKEGGGQRYLIPWLFCEESSRERDRGCILYLYRYIWKHKQRSFVGGWGLKEFHTFVYPKKKSNYSNDQRLIYFSMHYER